MDLVLTIPNKITVTFISSRWTKITKGQKTPIFTLILDYN